MNVFTQLWLRLFPAMHERNFRLYFYGQLISWSGNWLQITALGWLIKSVLHGTAGQIGLAAALPQVATALLASFGGTITDRFDERRLLYLAQAVQMVQAFALGYLTLTHHITIAWVYAMSLVLGISNALDRPTTHTLLMKVAGNHLRSAVAMNTFLIMAGASIGGFLASVLIPLVGLGGSFVANGVSFIPIFWTLARMTLAPTEKERHDSPITAMKLGWHYLLKNKLILFSILLNGIIVVVGFSYRAIFPVITTEMFHAGSRVNGLLYTAVGLGALVGTMIVSASQEELKKESSLFRNFITGGPLLAGTALICFGSFRVLWLDLVFLACAGLGVVLSSSTLRGSIQHHTQTEMRGRVMGFVFTIFMAGVALGSWLAGIFAGRIGSLHTVYLAGGLSLTVSIFLVVLRSKVFSLKLATV